MSAADPAWYASLLSYGQVLLTYVAPPLLAAALSGYAVHRWKGRGDFLEKRLDDLCTMMDLAADAAGEYWSKDQIADHPNSMINEAKLRAQLMKIAGLRSVVEDGMSESSAQELRSAESVFLREATGGNYGVHNRTADHFRIVAIRHAAASFVVAVRMARMSDLKGLRRRK